jgi:uncharacterized protein YjbI with pentapeptide repeats
MADSMDVLRPILEQGARAWNQYRYGLDVDEDIIEINGGYIAYIFDYHLMEGDLSGADFSLVYFADVDWSRCNLSGVNLRKSNCSNAYFGGSDLRNARLIRAYCEYTNFFGCNLAQADLSRMDGYFARFDQACLIGADLSEANLRDATFTDADLTRANLTGANLKGTRFESYVGKTDLTGVILKNANLSYANLRGIDLRGLDLSGVDFTGADLTQADLRGADLRGSKLVNANLVRAKIGEAKISNSQVYGVNVWDLEGEFEEQKELVITPDEASLITVDNIKVAQFIYLILNNREIRDVLNTLTSKTVLILGRFAIPERKAILDGLRNKLREYDLLPIVFDFDRPADKDFTETIKTLAGMCYFIIADVTNPKSSPLELQATVPDYQIPFVPIIQEGEKPFAMMVDLQKKYNWVLDTISYGSGEQLIRVLKRGIIDRAMKKRDELRLVKASRPTVISASQFDED